jgi:tetratricopeptide (TPR) repeat protein
MTFEERLDQALAMLQRRGRVTYRALKLQFRLDDDHLEALTEELLYAHPPTVADDGRGLIWTGETPPTPRPESPPASSQERAPRSYTPAHLSEKILQARLSLEGERKQVTVLFADLKGSMELLADRDPEEARSILDPVLARMMEAVHRYEGTVNQVMGDGIMALFGAPIAHEDHAIRACYAALALQAALRRYSDEAKELLHTATVIGHEMPLVLGHGRGRDARDTAPPGPHPSPGRRVPLLTQAVEQTTAMETIAYQALCRLSLGEAQMLASRMEEAKALAQHTLAHAHEHQERGYEAYALRLLGDIAAHRDPPESAPAVAHCRQALTLADELGMRPLPAHCHRALGPLYAMTGQREQARTALTTAIEMDRAIDMTFWLPQAEAALARMG